MTSSCLAIGNKNRHQEKLLIGIQFIEFLLKNRSIESGWLTIIRGKIFQALNLMQLSAVSTVQFNLNLTTHA